MTKSSRTYCGGTFLDGKELEESKINHKIELEYYTTMVCDGLCEEGRTYGIEIIKKEYEGTDVKIESGHYENICHNSNEINAIVDILKRGKVTPIGLSDVIEDVNAKQ